MYLFDWEREDPDYNYDVKDDEPAAWFSESSWADTLRDIRAWPETEERS